MPVEPKYKIGQKVKTEMSFKNQGYSRQVINTKAVKTFFVGGVCFSNNEFLYSLCIEMNLATFVRVYERDVLPA